MQKSGQFQLYIKSLQPNNGSLWKAIKRLTRHREKIPPLRHENGQLAITDKDRANIFASQLAEAFQPLSCTVPNNISIVEIKQFLSVPRPTSLPEKPISPGEISSCLLSLLSLAVS